MLNLSSLFFGMLAWMLPLVYVMRYRGRQHQNGMFLSILSIGACAISLCLQIFAVYQLVKIEDWAALLDTIGAVAFFAALLLTITISFNIVILFMQRHQAKE